jgi:plastocyanin
MRTDVQRLRAAQLAMTAADAHLIDRRAFLRTSGGLGLAALGLMSVARMPRLASAQEASPAPVATPVVGPQSDGTNLWRVQVGDMDMENSIDFTSFFPSEITINAGDSIWFAMAPMGPGFHTVTFLAGGEIPPIFIPDPEVASPAAGPPQLILNPDMAFPTESTVVDGATYVNSGVDVLRDPSQQVIYTFSTPGTYDYLCIPHQAVMKAKVIVQEAGSALPMDQAGYDAAAAEQLAALKEEGMAEIAEYAEATSEEQSDGSTLWTLTAGAGEGQARVNAFLPKEVEIKVGDSVKWVHRAPGEPHTVTFVGSDTEPPEDVIPGQFADGSLKLMQNNETLLPQGGNTFDGTGFMNSGWLGIEALGLPTEFTAQFTAAGVYTYYCILHGDAEGNGMAATLRVV